MSEIVTFCRMEFRFCSVMVKLTAVKSSSSKSAIAEPKTRLEGSLLVLLAVGARMDPFDVVCRPNILKFVSAFACTKLPTSSMVL